MKYTIKGCLMKYNTPWYNSTIISPGAFNSSDGKIVPCLKSFEKKDHAVGHAELSAKEDGVYYVCTMNESEESEELIQKIIHSHWELGLYANHIQRKDNVVTEGVIAAIAFHEKCDEASSIFEITTDDVDAEQNDPRIWDKTLKCPFCSGDPQTEYWLEGSSAYAKISCVKCGASIAASKPFLVYSNHMNPGYAFVKAEQQVIDAWSKRAGDHQ